MYQCPGTISRQAMMYLLTNGWSLNQTSLAMIPEQCAMSWENSVLTSARAGHSKSKCLSSLKAPVRHNLQTHLCLGNCKWRPCSMGSHMRHHTKC